MRAFLSLFRRRRPQVPDEDHAALFKARYVSFKALLESNSELLSIIADMEQKLRGDTVFGMAYVASQASRTAFHLGRMVEAYARLSGDKSPALAGIAGRLCAEMAALTARRACARGGAAVLPYRSVDRNMVDSVGGKSANLGEMASLGLPVPAGFAITTAACEAFLASGGVMDVVNRSRMGLDPSDAAAVTRASEAIQRAFLDAPLPQDLEREIRAAYRDLCAARGVPDMPVALRSSAIGEDGELSFAGQYLSVLGVTSERLAATYKMVLASLFTPRAMAYRLLKGIPFEGVSMGVACLELVPSRTAGVMYTTSPTDPLDRRILINAVFGLGVYAVDGTVPPDAYRLSRDPGAGDDPAGDLRVDEWVVACQERMLAFTPAGRVQDAPLAPDQGCLPCLTPDQARELARMGLVLERHYGVPQDVEWALHPDGRLVLLQTRPLRVDASRRDRPRPPRVAGYAMLLSGGDVACPGVAAGPAFHVRSEADLAAFPDGGVLVAEHSSPKYAVLLGKARAVLTDAGSATGHMASLVREFDLPSIFNLRTATRDIPAGTVVTVDALSGRIYAGEVPELLALAGRREGFMKGAPVFAVLEKLAAIVVPLFLTDPAAPEFRGRNARTVHDIMRFIHERSYGEMFQISDLAADQGGLALKLAASIPLDLYIIDLGDGVARPHGRRVRPDEIASAPFKALLAGMLHPDVNRREPKPINLGGFFSVMGEQLLGPPPGQGQRFGDKSYALISDRYLNFSSRVGYHYSVLDAYCGPLANENYISFSFKGGAADETRRNRRVRAISEILRALDFAVEVVADRVTASYRKDEPAEVAARLDQLGRLLQYTRQMDMLMQSEASVQHLARCFLNGNYCHDPDHPEQG
ncbi:MAG: PEP/pyruvate-binding domain-containing protein [Thermodesulfobacteriota bacterium]